MLENKETCTGCRACEQICPQDCISMVEDREGFLYPKVETDRCVNCGLCDQICHVKKKKIQLEPSLGWYGWCKDEQRIVDSSSGGAFSEIVEHWGTEETIVYGAAFNKEWNYVSQVRMNRKDYAPLRKSKYVVSDPKDSFSLVKNDLLEDRFVIYCGTPCQIAGLKAFLRNEHPRLLLIDFICHGTPSMQFLNRHLEYIGKKKNRKLVDFRSKHFGWRKHCLKVIFEDKIYIKPLGKDLYLNKFMKNESLRKSCYICSDSIYHSSDITIADFWEVGKIKPELQNSKGVSLMIGNTDKGKMLLPLLKDKMVLYEVPKQYFSYVYKNHSEYNQKQRDIFMKKYAEYSYEMIEKKFQREIIRKSIRDLIGRINIKIKNSANLLSILKGVI